MKQPGRTKKAANAAPGTPTPLERFHDRLQALEAALPVCRADPKKKAVHTLRSAIRSVESALPVFASRRGSAGFRNAGKALLATTHEMRRLAGRVRDFDVFEKLLEAHEAEIALDADDIRKTREQCRRLREACHDRRKRAAKRLVGAVESQELAVAAAAESLRAACGPALRHPFVPAELLRLADHQFRAHRELGLAAPTDEQLHTLRKAAKQARMQLELAPDDPEAVLSAERYHHLQQAGGDWHDWLALTAFAEQELGAHKAATRALAARRDRCLRTFQDQLATFRPARTSTAAAA